MTTIKLKNGSGAPTAGDLAQGEPALDLTNKRLYTEDSGGTVIEVGTNPTSLTTGAITSTGIDVTGTVTADGLTVDGGTTLNTSSTVFANLNYSNSNLGKLSTDGINVNLEANSNLFLKANSATRAKFDGNGDISFYEDTGTTAKLFWDASAENLTITGVKDTSSLILASNLTTVGGGALADYNQLYFDNTGGSGDAFIRHYANTHNDSNSALTFGTAISGTVAERMRIDSSGNVGIGESDPSGYWAQADNLVVGGTGNDGITIKSSTVGNGRLVFTDTKSSTAGLNDGGMIHYDHTADEMIFQANGDEAMRIDSSGNVGIGTTSFASALSVATNGGSWTTSSSDGVGINYNSGNANISTYLDNSTLKIGAGVTQKNGITIYGQTGGNRVTFDVAGSERMRTGSALSYIEFENSAASGALIGARGQRLSFLPNGTETMVIDSSGNVGIGTSSPSAKLHIEGSTPVLRLRTTADTEDSLIHFADTSSNFAGVIAYSHNGNDMKFYTNQNERMRIDSDGNVGINTAPTRLSSNAHTLNIKAGVASKGGVLLLESSDESLRSYFYPTSTGTQIGTLTNHDLLLMTNTTERMRISSNGKIGIGFSSAPNATLQIAKGATAGPPAAGASTGAVCFGNDTSANAYGLVMGADGFGKGYISAQRTDGTATTYDLAIQPNGGNVGIGTSLPNVAKMHVETSSGSNALKVGTSTQGVFIKATGTVIDYNSSGSSAGEHAFSTGNVERMRISTGGNVSIGTTSTGGNSALTLSSGSFSIGIKHFATFCQ